MISNTFINNYQIISSTKSGYIKRSEMALLESARKSKFLVFAKLANKDDFITNVDFLSDKADGRVLVTSRIGYYINYPLSLVPSVGLKSKGVLAIKLSKGDFLASTLAYDFNDYKKLKVGIFAENGKYKRLRISELSFDESRNKKGKLIARYVKTNPNYVLRAILIKGTLDRANVLNSNGE